MMIFGVTIEFEGPRNWPAYVCQQAIATSGQAICANYSAKFSDNFEQEWLSREVLGKRAQYVRRVETDGIMSAEMLSDALTSSSWERKISASLQTLHERWDQRQETDNVMESETQCTLKCVSMTITGPAQADPNKALATLSSQCHS
eukprot:6460794-Amphidinium_carterae.1